MSLVYLSAVYFKIDEGGWTNGSALSCVWRMDDIARFNVPAAIANSLALSTLAAFLTLAIEQMLGVMIWVRLARPLVLALGVALHLSIDLTLRIGFFSMAIIFVRGLCITGGWNADRDKVSKLRFLSRTITNRG